MNLTTRSSLGLAGRLAGPLAPRLAPGMACVLATAMAPAVLALTASVAAQTQDRLTELREKKLASEFLKNADWHTDFDAARVAARKSNKVIFAYFTRSYSP